MKRRKKRKNQVINSRRSVKLSAQPAGEKRDRGREIWRDLLKGLLFIVIVTLIKLAVEQTTLGKQLHLMSYNFLQLQLSSERAPVTIVDISDLEPQSFDIDGQVGKATPREPLREMITAITEHKPKAIGVDIDFSPDESGYIHPLDPEFFQFCLDMQKQRGVPIFLGVHRALTKPPAEWLGNEKYQELAASILIPKDSRRMLSTIKLEGEQQPGVTAEGSKPGKAMSVALADAYGREPSDSPRWLQQFRESLIAKLQRIGFIEKISERRLGPGLTVADFLVDFSPLESIEPLRTTNPVVLRDQSQRSRFQGKIVLLGDVAKASDKFVVPARDQPYPGVFLHACAASTLIKAPLYEVTGKGRLGIDILLLLAVLLTVTLIRLYYRNRSPEEPATHRLQGFLIVLVVFAAIVAGVVFVRATRVIWDDFFLALTVLSLHPSIERCLENLWKRIRKHAAAGFHRLVFKQHREPPR